MTSHPGPDDHAPVPAGEAIPSWCPNGPDAGPPSPGLYVHVPFCSAICPYCDFAVVRPRTGERSTYVESVLSEAAAWQWDAEVPSFDTVYLGGGTPSALPLEALARLVEGLRASLPIADDAEWSLEVNPEDVDRNSAAGWKSLGFTVVSLGVQALDDRVLRDLARRHDASQAVAAVERCVGADFERVSFDLIYSTGLREPEQWRHELEVAIGLGTEHLSCYELTFHDGTPFERQRLAGRRRRLPENERADRFLRTHRTLADLGMIGYEVSNFAREPGFEARHNRKYWEHEPYLGLGPSAHSFDGRRRWWNVRDPRAWAQRAADEQARAEARKPWIEGSEELTAEESMLEAIHLGLRTRRGVDLDRFERRFGIDLDGGSAASIERALEAGWLRREGRRLAPTLTGWLISDRLTVELCEQVPSVAARSG